MAPGWLCLTAGAAMALVATVAPATTPAQDATPAPGASARESSLVLETGIFAGTCDALGESVYPLADPDYGFALVPGGPTAGTPPAGEARVVGPDVADPAATSSTTVPASLDRLTESPHAIDVFGHPDLPGSVACGTIGGIRVGDELAVGLQERNGSGYAGTAHLRDNGDGTTTVSLLLASGLTENGGAGAVARPAAEDTAFDDVEAPIELTGLLVADGAFVGDELLLREGVPTIIHVANADDRPYRLRIDDLVTPTVVPAGGVVAIELTTPVAATYEAELQPADADEALDTLPVEVVPPDEPAP